MDNENVEKEVMWPAARVKAVVDDAKRALNEVCADGGIDYATYSEVYDIFSYIITRLTIEQCSGGTSSDKY